MYVGCLICFYFFKSVEVTLKVITPKFTNQSTKAKCRVLSMLGSFSYCSDGVFLAMVTIMVESICNLPMIALQHLTDNDVLK